MLLALAVTDDVFPCRFPSSCTVWTPLESGDGPQAEGAPLPARLLLTEFRALVVGAAAPGSAAGLSGDGATTKNFKKFRKVRERPHPDGDRRRPGRREGP